MYIDVAYAFTFLVYIHNRFGLICYHAMQVSLAQDMREILIRIGRFKSLEQHYTKVHLKPIQELWDNFDKRNQTNRYTNEKSEIEKISNNELQSRSPTISFFTWLPSFYDELLLYLEQEWKW